MAKEYSILIRTIGLTSDPADLSTDALGEGLAPEVSQALLEIVTGANLIERQPWTLVSHDIEIVERHLIVSVLLHRQLEGNEASREE